MNCLAVVQTSRTTAVSTKSLNDKFRSHGRIAPVCAWAGHYGSVAQRIQPRPWIGADQSASSISSQAARIHSSQSQPRLQTAIDQSEASSPGSFCYKSRCRSQFVSPVSPRTESCTMSSIGYDRYFSNRTLQFDISPRVNYWSNNPV